MTSRRRTGPIHTVMRGCVLASAICVGGCGGPAPVVPPGWDAYPYSSHVTCGAHPVLLTGDRQSLVVDGACRTVVVAGDHNDISVTLAPGGSIEITGAHNDVTWTLLPGSVAAPSLTDHGSSNTFHAG